LKKFIGDGPDDKIEMDTETRSGYGGPRLSIEAWQRLGFAKELLEDRFDEFRAESSDKSGGQKFDYTGVVNQ